jgi:DNA-binding MarR family transcriptional regulator
VIDFDTQSRVLLALYRLDKKDPLFSTVKEIAAEAKLSTSAVREHLQRLHYAKRQVEFSDNGRRTSWRLNDEGALKADRLRRLKANQRLVYVALTKLGSARYPTIGKKTGLHNNGVSQTLGALQGMRLIDRSASGLYFIR